MLQINADDNIGLIKNTEFEDHVKNMIKTWESN